MKKMTRNLVAMTLLAATSGAVQAVPVTMTFTADNFMLSQNNYSNDYVGGSVLSGGVAGIGAGDWKTLQTTMVDLAPGSYYAHFFTMDGITDNLATPNQPLGKRGFIGTIEVQGVTIASDSHWQSCDAPTSIAQAAYQSQCLNLSTWSPSTELGSYGDAPWGTTVAGGALAFGSPHDAKWIWSDANGQRKMNTFRVAFNVAAVPEPSILALFGLGILGLGFASRRKVQS